MRSYRNSKIKKRSTYITDKRLLNIGLVYLYKMLVVNISNLNLSLN